VPTPDALRRCVLYTPKDSTRAQLLEAKHNLQRSSPPSPSPDDERAAVDDGQTASTASSTATPTREPGRTHPRQIGIPRTATRLPILDITRRNIEDH
jgi:hypothetical protein